MSKTDTRVFRSIIVTPTPGKEAEIQALFSAVAEKFKAEQPGILQYHLFTEVPDTSSDATPLIIGQAAYESVAVADAVHQSDVFQQFIATVMKNGLMAKPLQKFECRLFAGFAREAVQTL